MFVLNLSLKFAALQISDLADKTHYTATVSMQYMNYADGNTAITQYDNSYRTTLSNVAMVLIPIHVHSKPTNSLIYNVTEYAKVANVHTQL